MSDGSKDPRELLVELEYGELEEQEAEAARALIEGDPELRQMQAALRNVRADLREWEDVEPRTTRIAFVGMPGAAPTAASGMSTWVKTLAVAASFVLGLFLAAAFVNTEIASTSDGWRFSSGLWPSSSATDATTAPAQTPPVSNGDAIPLDAPADFAMQVGSGASPSYGLRVMPEMDRWLNQRLPASPYIAGDTLTAEQIRPLLTKLQAERDTQIRALVRDMLADSELRQREEVDSLLTGVYQTFDAQRTDDLLFLAGEMGVLQESTGIELQRTNAVIDYLMSRVGEVQDQEQRDD